MATKKYVSLDKLTKYDTLIKSHIDTKDAATLKSAKDYADGLASNYEVAGAAATAEANAKAYADGLASNYEVAGEAAKVQAKLDEEVLRAKAAEEANAKAAKQAQDEVDALELVVQNIQENAYDDTELRGLINGLSTNKADKTQVATDIAAAVKVEEEARIAAVSGVQNAVDALSGTHATDKEALEDAIALKADQTALDAVSGVANAAATKVALEEEVNRAKGEEARIEGLVTAEAERAAGVEAGLDERLVEVEAFFKLAEGEQLDTAMDTLVEIQKYITEDGAAADEMVKDIAANAKAIEDHLATDHDFAAADATLKAELEGKINAKADSTVVEGIDGRLTTAEGTLATAVGDVSTLKGQMTTVQGAVATKAEQSALTEAIEALEGADEDLAGRIETLEGKFGGAEGSVEDQIADAKQEAISAAAEDATTKANAAETAAKGYTDAEIDKVEGTIATLTETVGTKAAQSDLTALAGRVTTAEGEIDTLQSEMDAVEALAAANKAAHEANASAIALKASQVDLEAAVARIAKNETDIASFVEVSEEEINKLFGIVAE